MEVSDQIYVPTALLLGQTAPRCPFDRRLGGPQSQSECYGEQNIACLYTD
jgi:hypothetical protein